MPKPIITEKIICLAFEIVDGLPLLTKNMIPPITSMRTAITGATRNITKTKMRLIKTKKSHNWQRQQTVPHGTIPSLGQQSAVLRPPTLQVPVMVPPPDPAPPSTQTAKDFC